MYAPAIRVSERLRSGSGRPERGVGLPTHRVQRQPRWRQKLRAYLAYMCSLEESVDIWSALVSWASALEGGGTGGRVQIHEGSRVSRRGWSGLLTAGRGHGQSVDLGAVEEVEAGRGGWRDWESEEGESGQW